MKRFTLALFAGLMLVSSAAFAQDGTMNLSWILCRDAGVTGVPAVNNLPDAAYTGAWNCDSDNPPALVMNVGFKPTQALTIFQGTTVQIDIQLQTAGLTDWWRLDAAGCRAGNIVQANVPGGSAQCASPYGAAIQAGGLSIKNGLGGPNRVRIEADWTRADAGAPLPAAGPGGYFAQALQVAANKTVAGFLGSPPACAGCNTPACIVLNKVIYAGGTQLFTITDPDLRANVTWYGGTGANCPGATPTKNSTWGHIKSLYR